MSTLHTLANGVRVLCDPIDGFETLALSVVAGRGARNESAAQSGWAHLLEHMVFKGAGGRSARQIVEPIEAAGGHLNAATGYERTSFQVRALKGGLALGMSVCADLMLRPTLDAAELELEKGVIAQEIAEAADDPDDLVFDLAQAAAFGDTALGRPVLGSIKSVAAAGREDLSVFRERLYAPDRLVISAAGAVDEDELLAAAEQAFNVQAAEAPPVDNVAFAGADGSRTAKLEQAHLVFLMPACGACDDDYFALRVFAEALGGGMSSRLFQEVREARGLAYNIDAYAETYCDTGVMGVYAGCAAGDAARAAGLAAEQLRALTYEAGAAEIARAKAQLKGSIFMARESAHARAEQGAGQILLFGRTLSPAELSAGIDAVGADDLRRVGERAMSRAPATAVLGPKAAMSAAEAFAEGLRA